MIENNINIPPMETGNLLATIKEVAKNGLIAVSWDEYDKSFKDFANGFKASDHLVFGYLDGNNKFYPANSDENVFDSYDFTGSIKIISYCPKSIIQEFKINGYDEKTRKAIFASNYG